MGDEDNDYDGLANDLKDLEHKLIRALHKGGNEVEQPVDRRAFNEALVDLSFTIRRCEGLSSSHKSISNLENYTNHRPQTT